MLKSTNNIQNKMTMRDKLYIIEKKNQILINIKSLQ